MVSSNIYRKVTIYTRLCSLILSGISISMFIIILFKVLDQRFPSEKPGYSALAVGALAFTLLWNIVALITTAGIKSAKFGRFFYPIGDSITLVELAVLGSIGFAHDDQHYLSNAMYRQYNNEDWLAQAMAGGITMLIVAGLQLFLIVFVIFRPTVQVQSDLVHPPSYLESEYVEEVKDVKEKELELDMESVTSYEMSPSADKKDMIKV